MSSRKPPGYKVLDRIALGVSLILGTTILVGIVSTAVLTGSALEVIAWIEGADSAVLAITGLVLGYRTPMATQLANTLRQSRGVAFPVSLGEATQLDEIAARLRKALTYG